MKIDTLHPSIKADFERVIRSDYLLARNVKVGYNLFQRLDRICLDPDSFEERLEEHAANVHETCRLLEEFSLFSQTDCAEETKAFLVAVVDAAASKDGLAKVLLPIIKQILLVENWWLSCGMVKETNDSDGGRAATGYAFLKEMALRKPSSDAPAPKRAKISDAAEGFLPEAATCPVFKTFLVDLWQVARVEHRISALRGEGGSDEFLGKKRPLTVTQMYEEGRDPSWVGDNIKEWTTLILSGDDEFSSQLVPESLPLQLKDVLDTFDEAPQEKESAIYEKIPTNENSESLTVTTTRNN